MIKTEDSKRSDDWVVSVVGNFVEKRIFRYYSGLTRNWKFGQIWHFQFGQLPICYFPCQISRYRTTRFLNNIQMNEELSWFMGLGGIYMMGGVYEAIDIFLGDWTCSSCPQIPILGRNEDSFSEGLLRGPQDLKSTTLKSLKGCSRMQGGSSTQPRVIKEPVGGFKIFQSTTPPTNPEWAAGGVSHCS